MQWRWVPLCGAISMVFGAAGCTINPDAAAPTDQSGDGGDAGTRNQGATPLPCDVEQALDTVCRNCHNSSLDFGAPMPLLTWEDTQKPAVSDPTKKVYELIGERIDAGTMPPAPNVLSSDAKAALDAWVQAGAPPGTSGQSCSGGGDGGTGFGGVGPEYLPCTPKYAFKAHDGTDPTQGFTVPTGGSHNFYVCFVYKAPFAPGEQATAWAPVIDQKAVLHHWILWESTSDPSTLMLKDGTPVADGAVGICGASPTKDSKFLMGWAPGGQNSVLPSDVGLHLDPGATLFLQIHYWNPSDTTGIVDRSGVAVCTDSGRPQEAGIMAVGNILINLPPHATTSVAATCSAGSLINGLKNNGIANPSVMHVLSDGPHMHRIGIKFSTILNHPDGTHETLVDVDPFDFNEQTSYPHDPFVDVNLGDGFLTPGDSLTTTCTYDNESNNTVTFGERTEDEMCFDFMMVYPFPTASNGGMLNCMF